MNNLVNALMLKYGENCVTEPNGTCVIDVAEEDLCPSDIVQYIANLISYIKRLKEIHWSTDNDKTHNLCDSITWDLWYAQDALAEDYMGLAGAKLQLGVLDSACDCDGKTLPEVLTLLRNDTLQMYNVIHDNYEYKGIEKTLNNILDTVNANLYKETQK